MRSASARSTAAASDARDHHDEQRAALRARVRAGVVVAGEQLGAVGAVQRERQRQPGGGQRAQQTPRMRQDEVEDERRRSRPRSRRART